jgi:ribosome maturation factor RimP
MTIPQQPIFSRFILQKQIEMLLIVTFLFWNTLDTNSFQILQTTTRTTRTKPFTFTLQSTASKVTDTEGETPDLTDPEPELIDPKSIPSLNFDPNNHPIPHQPWRRGDTDGCHDPISSPWRMEAEDIISLAVSSVGAKVQDVTWFMGAVVITLEDKSDFGYSFGNDINDLSLNKVTAKHINNGGMDDYSIDPEVRVMEMAKPKWIDENDPEPEDDYGIYRGEEDGRIGSMATISDNNGNEQEDSNMMEEGTSLLTNDPYAERTFDEETGTYLPPPPRPTRESTVRNISYDDFETYISNGMKVNLADRDERILHKLSHDDFLTILEDFRLNVTPHFTPEQLSKRAKALRARFLKSADLLEFYPEEYAIIGWEEANVSDKLAVPTMERSDGIDTKALEIISKAIIDALRDVESSLKILSRHEVILTSPGDEEIYLETQRQFDANRGTPVVVQTEDPFGSNRALKGRLVDRNALDVVINMKGRMVTIPLSMVAYIAFADMIDHVDPL